MLRLLRTHPLARLLPAVLGVAAAAPAARAGLSDPVATQAFQLGEQDFANHTPRVTDRQIHAAGAGEAYPFNGTVFGDDRKAGKKALGKVRYTHTFDPADDYPAPCIAAAGISLCATELRNASSERNSPSGRANT